MTVSTRDSENAKPRGVTLPKILALPYIGMGWWHRVLWIFSTNLEAEIQ